MNKPNLFGWTLIASFCFFIGWLTYILAAAAMTEKIELDKDKWACTKQAQTLRPITTVVGKVPITTHSTVTICTQYTRS